VVRRSLLFSDVRVHSYCRIEDALVPPGVEIGRHCVLKRVILDRECRLEPGTKIGVDPIEDRKRFHMTEKGIVLVTPEMLGDRLHHAR